MAAKIVRIGKYYINLNNILYVVTPGEMTSERRSIDVFFTEKQTIHLKDQEAVDFVNLLEECFIAVNP